MRSSKSLGNEQETTPPLTRGTLTEMNLTEIPKEVKTGGEKKWSKQVGNRKRNGRYFSNAQEYSGNGTEVGKERRRHYKDMDRDAEGALDCLQTPGGEIWANGTEVGGY